MQIPSAVTAARTRKFTVETFHGTRTVTQSYHSASFYDSLMSFAPEFYWENGRRYHQGGGCSTDPVSSKQLLIHLGRIYSPQRPGNMIPQFLNTHSTHASIQTELDREDMKHNK